MLRSAARLLVPALAAATSAGAQTLLTSNTFGGSAITFASVGIPSTSTEQATIGPVTVTGRYADGTPGQFNIIGGYELGANGTWRRAVDGPPLGVGTTTRGNELIPFLRFTFATPVGAVGGFVNYCVAACGAGAGPAILRAYDAEGGLVGAYDVTTAAPISTPGGVNAGAFRGIDGQGRPISYVEWGGSYAVIRDLSFGTSVVPEPGTWAFVGTGVLALAGVARRARRSTP